MQLIISEPVLRLVVMEKAASPDSRMFLCQIFLEPQGGEPSWAVQHDRSNKKHGIRLECKEVTLWCTEDDKDLLHNHVLIKDSTRGFLAVPSVILAD